MENNAIEEKIRNIGSNLLDAVTEERYGMQKHHPPEDIPKWFVNDILTEIYTQGKRDGKDELLHSWSKWKFGKWFFKRQKKELDEFLKDYPLDVKDIDIKEKVDEIAKKLDLN